MNSFIQNIILCNFIFIIFFNASASTEERVSEFSLSRRWQSHLLYSRKNATASLVRKDSPFFLSSRGYKDPRKELIASLEMFKDPDNYIKRDRGHPQCLFPARFEIIKKAFKLKVSQVICPALEEWKMKFKAQEIAVVFASQFVSNPASVMGHSFLMFKDKDNSSYLNPNLGYAAEVPPEEGALIYAYKGLTGGYKGLFFTNYYYEKIHEYKNIEQRDMWEYVLNLNQEEKEAFIKLAWELKQNAFFDYYFLDENCSYLILALIEAVRPGAQLVNGYGFYVPPYITLQKLQESSLIEETVFHPSLRKELLNHYENLNGTEKSALIKTVQGEKLPEETGALFNDTLASYLLLKKHANEGVMKPDDKALFQEVLLRRSQQQDYKIPSPPLSTSPLNAHGPHQFDYSIGRISGKNSYQELSFRPGIHDIMDKPDGFLKHSGFNFFETGVRHFPDTGSIEFSEYKLFEIQNSNIYHPLDPALAWKISAKGIKRELFCSDCFVHEFSFSVGGSFDLNLFELNILGGVKEVVSTGLTRGHLLRSLLEVELLKDFSHSKVRLSNIISSSFHRGHPFFRLDTSLNLRVFELFSHCHAGLDLRYQALLRGNKSFFDNSLVINYDF
jgi:hypothetical protein